MMWALRALAIPFRVRENFANWWMVFFGNLLPIASRHFVEDFSATLTPEGNVPLLSHYIPIHIPITCCVNRFIPITFPSYSHYITIIPIRFLWYSHHIPTIHPIYPSVGILDGSISMIFPLNAHCFPIRIPLNGAIPIAPARRIPAPLPAQVPRPREDIMGIESNGME